MNQINQVNVINDLVEGVISAQEEQIALINKLLQEVYNYATR